MFLLDFLLLRNDNDLSFDFFFGFSFACCSFVAVDVDNVALLLIGCVDVGVAGSVVAADVWVGLWSTPVRLEFFFGEF